MTTHRKVAISIPDETYLALEKARAKLGQSRSEAVATAVREWLKGLDASEASRRYIEGYLRVPEVVTEEDEAWIRASLAGWGPWEPGEPSRVSESRTTPASLGSRRRTSSRQRKK